MGRINTTEAWNALFSSLAFAEKAAANECLKIAERFRLKGLNRLATEYEQLALEENHHHQLALSIVKEFVPLTEKAQLIYDGKFFVSDDSLIERLMSVHFVFEPSALAFLGYVSTHAKELFEDAEWADQITKAFNRILRDEVHHVHEGKEVIRQFWAIASHEEKKIALKTMRKHRAFLKAGLLNFFSGQEIKKYFVLKMLSRFDFFYEKAIGGILNDYEEIAS